MLKNSMTSFSGWPPMSNYHVLLFLYFGGSTQPFFNLQYNINDDVDYFCGSYIFHTVYISGHINKE